MNCTVSTLQFYRFTVGVFLAWIESQRATDPQQVTARHVMQYLAQLINAGRKDTTIHANARAILTLVRYWHAEGYVSAEIKFDMLKLSKKRLPVLTAEQWQCERQSHNFIYG